MTNRDFYTAVIEANISAEATEFATAAIAKLNARNEARKAKVSPKKEANEALKAQIVETAEANVQYTSATIGADFDISTAKAAQLMTQLVKEGKFIKTEVKIKGKGKVNAYVKA
jgi:predicted HTH transcriptional regulator